MSGSPAPQVSVVVPVYNPGPWIEPCIRSILGQTLPRAELEAIFVDDGSTDGTAERLDRLAADEPGVSVLHIPPSGAPGRPRNVGIAAARGTYIQFLDADDELTPDALERLLAMARRNHSDIVVGRFVSPDHPFNQRLFDRSIERCTLETAPELANGPLHVGRLFRTAFLRDNGITFPEGWRLGEDQAFCLTAYFKADVISVLGDGAPCYRYSVRHDASNLSAEPTDPDRFSANLEAIMAIVLAGTRPGPIRTRLIRRFLRHEVLGQFREPTISAIGQAERAAVVAWAGDFVARYVDPEIERWFHAVDRVRIDLIRAGRFDQLLALARLEERQAGYAMLTTASWADGRLRFTGRAGLADAADGSESLRIIQRGGAWFLDPRCAEDLGLPPVDVTAELGGRPAYVDLVEPETGLERPLEAARHPAYQPLARDVAGRRPAIRFEASMEPMRLGSGGFALDPGVWALWLTHSLLGIGRRTRLRPDNGFAMPGPAIVGDPPRVIIPVADEAGLAIDVNRTTTSLAGALAGRPITLLGDGRTIVLGLDVATDPGAWRMPAELVLRARGQERTIGAELRPSRGMIKLEATAGHRDLMPIPAGKHVLAARLDGPLGPELPIGTARVATDGRIRIKGPTRVALTEQLQAAARYTAAHAGRSLLATVARARLQLEHAARSRARRLPEPVQRHLRELYGPTGRT